MESMSINIVSYNCHGFRNSSGYVKELLEQCDILCLQEHWLLDQQLCDLNICQNFAVTGVSGMASDCVIHGRPYGGCAVYVRNTLSSSISHCQVVSRRFCGIKVKLAGGRILLVVCAYLPFDNGHASDSLKFSEVLCELEAFLSTQCYDLLAVVGDFNVDFTRTNRPRTGELLRFMQATCLEASDLHFPSIQFTYESDNGLARSWVDHFLFSTSASHLVRYVDIVCSGDNLSDHLPLAVSLDCQHVVSSSVGSCSTQARRVAWHKATSDQINAYQSCVRESYKQFVIPDHVLNCSDPRCKVHCDYLSTLCRDLVCCLVSCADATIPPASHRKRVAGWKDEIPPFKERSLFWNRLWYESGCPQAGVLFQLRKHAKTRYKYAVRRVMRNQDKLRRAKLADALSHGKSRHFWQEVRSCSGRKQVTPHSVDGVCGNENLVEHWADKFKNLFTSSNPNSSNLLAQALADLEVSVEDMGSLSFSADSVCAALKKLKHGKSEGGSLTSDHLIFAPRCFAEVLAPVFTCLVRHGYMPSVFRDAVILPIPKGGNTDLSQSANYRGIALASCFSKLLEYCSCLLSSHLQFGFKPGLSTTLCTGVLKATISRYLAGGSCVYGCLVDASKAFDSVDHTLLLEKLLKRGLPICVVRFLLTWYQTQRLRVSWNGVQSGAFPVSRGVRQGGVISPILFALYI